MTILGLDLSLESTGYCVLSDKESIIVVGTIKSGTKSRGIARVMTTCSRVLEIAQKFKIENVFIEGYAHGRKQKAHYLGELGGVIRGEFYSEGIQFYDIPPSSLKKFVTGSGKAKKEVMLEKTYRKWGFGSETLKNNDEVDAYCLAKMGHAFLNPGKPAAAYQQVAILKVSAGY